MFNPEGVPQTDPGSSQTGVQPTGTNMPAPNIAFLPDTPDTRLLVTLTSHANDRLDQMPEFPGVPAEFAGTTR